MKKFHCIAVLFNGKERRDIAPVIAIPASTPPKEIKPLLNEFITRQHKGFIVINNIYKETI